MSEDFEDIEINIHEVLSWISPDVPRDHDDGRGYHWLRIATILQAGNYGFSIFDEWSSSGGNYNKADTRNLWKSVKQSEVTKIRTPNRYLEHIAKKQGYQPTGPARTKSSEELQREKAAKEARQAKEEQKEKANHARAAKKAQQLWEASSPIKDNPYLSQKGVQAAGELRQITTERAKEILYNTQKYPLNGSKGPLEGDLLIFQVGDETGITTCQLIDGKGSKYLLKDGRKSGCNWEVGSDKSEIQIGEGLATVLTAYEAKPTNTISAIDASGVLKEAIKQRALNPDSKITILGELKKDGSIHEAHLKACKVARAHLAIPNTIGSDFNDMHLEKGLEAVREAIESASMSQEIDENDKEDIQSFYCKETLKDFYENYQTLSERREEGKKRQCEKFAYLLLTSMLHRLNRSLDSIYSTAKAYCEPSKALVVAVQKEVQKRDDRALATQSLKSDHYLMRDEKNMLDLDYAVRLILDSPEKLAGCRFDHGSNKTQGIALQIAQEMGSSLWVSHRAILANTTAKKITGKGGITLASYQEVNANAAFHVATCINSIPRFVDQQAKALIIDEAAQVLTHFEGDAWNSEAVRKEALESLKEVAKKAQKIILLDADLTDYHVKAWGELLECKALVVDSEPSKVKRNVEIVYSASPVKARKQALLDIVVKARQGLKVVVQCESCDAAKALDRDLQALNIKTLTLHRETEEKIKEAFSNNPDFYIDSHKPSVLIYTSLIGSGVSIEGGYFDTSIGLFGGNILTPEDYIQMMRRDREITSFKVFYSQTHKDKNRLKPIFEGFDTSSIDTIKLSAKKLKAHKRVYNEVIFEHLLRERNFSVTITREHQQVVSTKTSEIKEEEAEEIFKATPRDIIATTPEEHREAQSWEVMTWLGEIEETYQPRLSDCLAYRTDKAKFKRVCYLSGALETDEAYKNLIIDARLLYSELKSGVDETGLNEFFSRVWELKEFLILLNLLPEDWIMRDCKKWPKKRLIQAAQTLSDYWGISHTEEPKPKPISAKKAQLASELELVEDLLNQGLGIKKIVKETGLKHAKVQRLRKMILDCQGIKNGNNSQSVYKSLEDNHKNDTLADSHHEGNREIDTSSVSDISTNEGEPQKRRNLAWLMPKIEELRKQEIKAQATVEGAKTEPFTHYADTSEPPKEITVKYDPACPHSLKALKGYAPYSGRIEARIKTATRVSFLSRKASNDPVYLAEWVQGLLESDEAVQEIIFVGDNHWPTITLEAA